MSRRLVLLLSKKVFSSKTYLLQAIGRLTTQEAYDRIYRFRLASHASILHKDLPKEQWVKPEEVCFISSFTYYTDLSVNPVVQDVRYLAPHVEEVHKENLERAKWDNILVQRK